MRKPARRRTAVIVGAAALSVAFGPTAAYAFDDWDDKSWSGRDWHDKEWNDKEWNDHGWKDGDGPKARDAGWDNGPPGSDGVGKAWKDDQRKNDRPKDDQRKDDQRKDDGWDWDWDW